MRAYPGDETGQVTSTIPRRDMAVVAGPLALVVFVLGFVVEDQHWSFAGTMLVGFALIAATTVMAVLALLVLERRRERR
jgi:hypothetical protein